MWINADRNSPDQHGAFLGQFVLPASLEVELQLCCAADYLIWIDGALSIEGPVRFAATAPEHQTHFVQLTAGTHTVAAHVHFAGIAHRYSADLPADFGVRAFAAGRELPVDWRCAALPGFRPQMQRINPELSWIEWSDTRLDPAHWHLPGFDAASWGVPDVSLSSSPSADAGIASLRPRIRSLSPMASGSLVETFGYETDDIPTRFFLRDLRPDSVPPQGLWRRYDLGRVRLGRLNLVLDLPAGAIVEMAYSEKLLHDRVPPYITLSLGRSCNLDHYVAYGGVQEFLPVVPKGGRYVEVHVLTPADRIQFVAEEYVERTYHEEPDGAFSCSDNLLNRIWSIGVETYRACTEDSLIDNPTRERGQWIGDSLTVGLHTASAAYTDLRLIRRAIRHSASCADARGMVAGLCPGDIMAIPSFALHWTIGCLDYVQATGDRSLLTEQFPQACRNMEAFRPYVGDQGLTMPTEWSFIDWGYRSTGSVNLALNLFYRRALQAMSDWASIVGDENAPYASQAAAIGEIIVADLQRCLSHEGGGWPSVGYHASALALRFGQCPAGARADCMDYLKSHILSCFPNDHEAPRLSDPNVTTERLITPFFSHFAFPALIEHGEMPFVLDQYRRCWGWMMDAGCTTWLEVFDFRWSQCHHWSGCPTWQLSRYVLGVHPQFHLEENCFLWHFEPGELSHASGRVPLPSGQFLAIDWMRMADAIRFQLRCSEPVTLRIPEGHTPIRVIEIHGELTLDIDPLSKLPQ